MCGGGDDERLAHLAALVRVVDDYRQAVEVWAATLESETGQTDERTEQ